MKILTTLFVLFLVVIFAQSASAQGKISILFDGMLPTGNLSFFGKSSSDVVGLNKLKPDQRVFPGAEIRFNQNGRVSFGVGYQRWRLKDGSSHHTHIRPDGSLAASWDESSSASANIVTGTLYVNILTHGKVRPFVGLGGGYAPFEAKRNVTNYQTNTTSITPGFAPPSDIVTTSTVSRVVIKGVGGLNFYPAKHVLLSFGGGYINGPAVSFGAGFTF